MVPIIALADGTASWERLHLESTTAEHAELRHGVVVLRARSPGTYTATLIDSGTAEATIDSLPDISELEDPAGIGRYSATANLGTGRLGDYLDLIQVQDTFRVVVEALAVAARPAGHDGRHRPVPAFRFEHHRG